MTLIGDRERERAAAALREHYVRGRLSVEELTERLQLVLDARRDGDVRRALESLPGPWRDRVAQLGPQAVTRSAKRLALVAAVWSLWWAATLVLLVGFVASVALHGLTLTAAILFPALWCACTLLARRLLRRSRP